MRKYIYRVWFKVYVGLKVWIYKKQQYFITTTLIPRVANGLPS